MNGWMDGWMDRTVTPSFMLSLDMEEGDEDFFLFPRLVRSECQTVMEKI